MMAAGRKKKGKKDTSFTTWKLNLENTVNADPRLGPACLKIVRAYLDWMGSPLARPFLSIIHLRIATALTEPTIIKARRELEKEGYFVPDGRTSSGAVMYRIVNSGENRVLDHISIARETLRRKEAEKKERERQKRLSPKETLGPPSPKKTLGQEAEMPSRNFRDSPKEALGNNVYKSVEAYSYEREGIIKGIARDERERVSLCSFAIPENTAEGQEFLVRRNVPDVKIARYLRMLMAGELTAFDIEEWSSG
ncbi:hypothetical protein GOC59_11615 [Sinorhizobium medicae]|nr:hypothetical protein [Sinorhizobium medicae]MDX0540232.1 hypothetical protein [Sinorhizobium medicae]MDX1148422.1 hypothetical protein [Sinorhizobium medicae]